MKNPFQKRTHIPQNPHALMMQEQMKRQKQDADAIKKKAESLLLPLFIANSESVLDATVWVNTLSAKVQELAAERAIAMKVSDYEKELRLNTTAKHGARYDVVIDAVKDLSVKEVVQLMETIKLIINAEIEKKFSKAKLGEFLEKKPTIIT